MSEKTGPAGDVFDPIERASRDEVRALQRERLAWTLRHAYENVPHYRRAFDEALGDRANLTRFADASAPLIEALSTAVVDLGARSHLTCNLGPMPEKIGTFDVELVPEFLRAFTQYGRFTLHLNCHYGDNAHHKVESGVKALAVALREGIAPRSSGTASTKGVVD